MIHGFAHVMYEIVQLMATTMVKVSHAAFAGWQSWA